MLVNNAGGGVAIKEVAKQTIDEIDAVIRLNLNSVIYGCREFADMMKSQKKRYDDKHLFRLRKRMLARMVVLRRSKSGSSQLFKGNVS